MKIQIKTIQRYIAYIHKIKIPRKGSVLVALNYIIEEYYIETVRFGNWGQTAELQGLDDYLKDFHAIVHRADVITISNWDKYTEELYWDFGIELLPHSTNRANFGSMPLQFWKDYFESYEVVQGGKKKWIIESPYADEITLPGWYQIQSRNGNKIKLVDIHAQ